MSCRLLSCIVHTSAVLCWVSHRSLGRQYFAVQKHSRVPSWYPSGEVQRERSSRPTHRLPGALWVERQSMPMQLAHQPSGMLLSIKKKIGQRGLLCVQCWEGKQFSWIRKRATPCPQEPEWGISPSHKTENFLPSANVNLDLRPIFELLSTNLTRCMSIFVCTRNP